MALGLFRCLCSRGVEDVFLELWRFSRPCSLNPFFDQNPVCATTSSYTLSIPNLSKHRMILQRVGRDSFSIRLGGHSRYQHDV